MTAAPDAATAAPVEATAAPADPTEVPVVAPDPNGMRDLFDTFARERVRGWSEQEHAYWCDTVEFLDHDSIVAFIAGNYRATPSENLHAGRINAMRDGWTLEQIADIEATAAETYAPDC